MLFLTWEEWCHLTVLQCPPSEPPTKVNSSKNIMNGEVSGVMEDGSSVDFTTTLNLVVKNFSFLKDVFISQNPQK